MTNLRERVQRGDTLLGCFLSLGSPLTAEICGLAGFDWTLIDLEHGAGSEREALSQMQALAPTGAAAVVRVESTARQRAHRMLDLGAHGIMFPRVNTAEDARAAVAAMRYPPAGVRGVAFANRACGFGAHREYLATANHSLVTVVQIETAESVANVDEIAAVDGADVLFIGPSDLTQSLGIFGQFDDPCFVDAVARTAAAGARHGKATGILLPKPDDFARYYDQGFRFIAAGNDGVMVANSARGLVSTLRAAEKAVN